MLILGRLAGMATELGVALSERHVDLPASLMKQYKNGSSALCLKKRV